MSGKRQYCAYEKYIKISSAYPRGGLSSIFQSSSVDEPGSYRACLQFDTGFNHLCQKLSVRTPEELFLFSPLNNGGAKISQLSCQTGTEYIPSSDQSEHALWFCYVGTTHMGRTAYVSGWNGGQLKHRYVFLTSIRSTSSRNYILSRTDTFSDRLSCFCDINFTAFS